MSALPQRPVPPPPLRKYPRTPHLEGSRLQPGDEDLESVSFAAVAGRQLVVEEKVDGANAGISFDAYGRLWLQSRGHVLRGGARERHFDLFKRWAHANAAALWAALLDRYVLYGEWLYAKHTVFYDRLAHYFLEFDVLDRREGIFLSTERRRALLAGVPALSVPVLWSGAAERMKQLVALVGPSRYQSPAWRESLRRASLAVGLDPRQVARETDSEDLMEGLYIKVEQDGRVVERYKYVRASFLTAVVESGGHWAARPIVPNQLAPEVELFV